MTTDAARTWIGLGALVMALGVGVGAFGAHGLSPILEANGRVDTFETASRYHLLHGLGLLLVAWLIDRRADRRLRWAGIALLIGLIFFSGSLYVLAIFDLGIMGAVAPIGGTAFVIGWLLVAWVAWQPNRKRGQDHA